MSARTSRSTVSLVATLGLPVALGACSAIVQPDPTRLGGIDAGESAVDTGPAVTPDAPGTDTGPRPDTSVDAYLPLPPDSGRDGGPVCPPSCDDDIDCTIDACEDGRCTHEADDSLCPGERCSVMLGCVPTICTTNDECQDDDRCNGAERCDPAAGTDDGCVDAAAPLDCNDGVSCTDDHCAPDTGCYHDRFDARCDDGVACTTDVCTGTAGPTGCEVRLVDALCNGPCQMGGVCRASGCSDTVPRVCPGDGNPCTVESCDAALGGCIAEPLDADGDGFPAMSATGSAGMVACAGGTDCNDGRPGINPGATEVCGNGADDDCNAATSDVCPTTSGDTCATARPITITGGTGSATVMFSTVRDDYRTSCSGSGGRDAIFYFDVTSTSDVRIETTGMVDTVIASSTTCSNDALAPRCNDDRNPDTDTTSRLWVRPVVVPAGTASVRVYVLVEEYSGADPDPVTLTVTLTSPTINTCPVGSSRPLDISGGGTVFGELPAPTGVSALRGTCQPAGVTGPEAIFRIEESDRVLHQLEATAPGFVPDLYVRYGGCISSGEIACERGMASGMGGGTATLDDVTGMRSDTLFYVFMDNFPSGGGPYTFTYDP